MKEQKWILKGMLLGLVFFAAAFFVKPIGVSTQFSMLSGAIHCALVPGTAAETPDEKGVYASTNAYYAKSGGKLVKSMRHPWNYDFVFVLSIPLGAFIAASLLKRRGETEPQNGQKDRGAVPLFLNGFAGGFVILYGARMADGCTSGHMMAGMSQGSLSGFVFAAAVFAAAVPTALLAKRLCAKKSLKGGK